MQGKRIIVPLEYNHKPLKEYTGKTYDFPKGFQRFCSDWTSILLFKPFPLFYMLKHRDENWKKKYRKAKRRFYRDYHDVMQRTLWRENGTF